MKVVICVSGGPGQGKSTVVNEIRKALESSKWVVSESKYLRSSEEITVEKE
jgi:uridine kinase